MASASCLHMTDAPIRPSGTFPRDAGEGMHLLPTRGSFCLRSKDSPRWRQHPANVCHHSAQGADRRHASPCLRPAPVGCGSRSVASASCLRMTDAPIRPSGTFPRDVGEGMHLLPTRGSSAYVAKTPLTGGNMRPTSAITARKELTGVTRARACGRHRLGAEADRRRVRHACASPMPPSALRAPSPVMRGKGCISCRRGVLLLT